MVFTSVERDVRLVLDGVEAQDCIVQIILLARERCHTCHRLAMRDARIHAAKFAFCSRECFLCA